MLDEVVKKYDNIEGIEGIEGIENKTKNDLINIIINPVIISINRSVLISLYQKIIYIFSSLISFVDNEETLQLQYNIDRNISEIFNNININYNIDNEKKVHLTNIIKEIKIDCFESNIYENIVKTLTEIFALFNISTKDIGSYINRYISSYISSYQYDNTLVEKLLVKKKQEKEKKKEEEIEEENDNFDIPIPTNDGEPNNVDDGKDNELSGYSVVPEGDNINID